MADQNRTKDGATEPAAATAEAAAPAAPAPSGARKAKATTVKTNASTKTAALSKPATAPHVQPRRAERRPEMVRQRRDERRKEYERRKRQWLYTRIVLGAVALVVVGGLIWGIIEATRDDASRPEGVQEFSYTGGDHILEGEPTDLEYPENPPVGGKHAGIWQTCGYYDAPIAEENAVHSLEHGAVWITYRADLLDEEQVADLRDRADESYVLVSPRPEQAEPVVLTAWNNQLRLQAFDGDAIGQFVGYFRQGGQEPERGATCGGGVGQPL